MIRIFVTVNSSRHELDSVREKPEKSSKAIRLSMDVGKMPRNDSTIEKIRAELVWVNETPNPNKCGCHNAREWSSEINLNDGS